MSVGYAEIVFPDVDAFNLEPTPAHVRQLLNELQSLGWIRDVDEDGMYKSLATAHRAIDSWAPPAPFKLWLAGGLSDETPEEWPDNQNTFEPWFCEDVEFACSPNLLLFPSGMNEATMPCAACGDELLTQPWRRYERDSGSEGALERYEFSDYVIAPTTCLACGTTPRYQDITFRGDVTITCAVFKLAIRLAAARGPSSVDVHLDPGVLSKLSAACGIPLRSAGVFS
jgi:hypothetical protein